MKRSSFVGLLSATILVSTAAPSLSGMLNSSPLPDGRSIVRLMAQHEGAASEPVLLAQADFDGEDVNHEAREIGPPDIVHGAPKPGFHLAAKLAAAETYVGITSAQLDAWRAYTAALIELVERPELDRGPGGPRRGRPDGPAPAQSAGSPPAVAPLFTERLVDRAIERGKKAETLKAAIAALRPVLTPEQNAKLRDAERSFLPPPGPPVPGGPPGDEHAGGHHPWHGELPPPPMFPPVVE
jgi:hypothetical protein